MKFETLDFKREGAVGILSIHRPQAMNALNAQVLSELRVFVENLNQESEDASQPWSHIRALIITGAGEKAFVAGADIKEMDSIDSSKAMEFAQNGQLIFSKIEQLKIPTLAAVNGFALGGGLELALSCDFIVASKTAKMGLPEVSLGLIPGYGGTQRLSRCCGKNTARFIALTGDIFTADQCAQWGLVTQITEPQDLMTTCMKIATTLAKRSPRAVALAKQAIQQGADSTLAQGLDLEAELFAKVFRSEDKKEGVRAFIEKRPPQFTGK